MVLVNDVFLFKYVSIIFKNFVFNFDELILVENMVKIFVLFEKVIIFVCVDQYFIMYKVFFIVIKFMRVIEILDDDVVVIKKIKQKMLVEMSKRI